MPQGAKADQGKPRWDLLPLWLMDGVVRAFEAGANKYAPDDWMNVPDGRRRYFAATMRHLTAFQGGEEVAQDDGIGHIDHAIASLLILKYLDKKDENARFFVPKQCA